MEALPEELCGQTEETPMGNLISDEISRTMVKCQHSALKLQDALHRIAIMRHTGDSAASMLRGMKYSDFFDMVTRAPMRVHLVLSPNSAQFLSDWVKDFVTQPSEFAKAVHKAFPVKNIQLLLFSRVTFPAIFHHFVSLEYLELGEQFLKEYLLISPGNFPLFFCSFMNSAYSFCDILWRTYDRIICAHERRNQSMVCFSAFLRSLKLASAGLSISHVRVLEFFKNANPALFTTTLVNDFLKQSLVEAMDGRKLDESSLWKVLDFAACAGGSKHFELIYNAMIPKFGTKWVPHQSEVSPNLGRTIILFSAHEASLIERIAMVCPNITKLKHSRSVSISEGVYQNFQPVYYEFSMSSFQKVVLNDTSLFGHAQKLSVSDDTSLKRRWSELEITARILGVTPLNLLKNGSVQYKCLFSNDKALLEYGRALCWNNSIDSRKQYDTLIGLLSCQKNLDDLFCCMTYLITIVIHRCMTQIFAAERGFAGYMGALPTQKKPLNECLVVQRYYDIFQLRQISRDVSGLVRIRMRNSSKFTTRIKNSDSWDSFKLKKKRRQSFSMEDGDGLSWGKSILAQIQTKNNKSPLQTDVYLRTLEDWHHDDRLVATLKEMYLKLVAVVKGQKNKGNERHNNALPYLRRIMVKGDDLVYVRRGPSVSWFTQLAEELAQVHIKFFMNPDVARTRTGAEMMEMAAREAETDGFFEAFLWYEKLFPGSPDLMSRIPKHQVEAVEFVRNSFLEFLGNMDSDFLVKIEEFRQHLTVAGRF